jgi:uncharacterized protein with NRDE domain
VRPRPVPVDLAPGGRESLRRKAYSHVCTLAIYVRTFPEFPAIVAANRDEFFSRATSPPLVLDQESGIFGGRDDVAGGTWLAVNRHGVVAALLNRRTDDPPDQKRESRGQLCLAMLREPSAETARAAIVAQAPQRYNPFNLLVADARHAWIATNLGAAMMVTDLDPGLHLITNLDLNDPTCPRIAASYQLFAELLRGDAPKPSTVEFRDRLHTILSAHDTELDPRSPGFGNSLCLHSAQYGTRSSSLIFLDGARRWSYFHANEPPCRGHYAPQPVMECLANP